MSQGNSTVEGAEHSLSGFASQLVNVFKAQFGEQSQALNFLQSKMTAGINNPQGFTPQAKTGMLTQATEGVANEFNQANTASKEMQAQQGGNGLPSGVAAQTTAANANAAATTEAAATNQINLADAQQQQQNYWNSVSGENQIAEERNPLGFAGAAESGFGGLSALSNADTSARSASFGGTMTSALGTAVGSFLGGGGKIAGVQV